jgi:hypothetical protein
LFIRGCHGFGGGLVEITGFGSYFLMAPLYDSIAVKIFVISPL